MGEGTEDLLQIISKNINYLLESRGDRAVDIALALDVSQATVSSWVNGKKLPRAGAIQQLADYFKVSKKELLVPKEERDREERAVLAKVNLLKMIDSADRFEDITLTDADKEFIKSVTRLYLNSKQK